MHTNRINFHDGPDEKSMKIGEMLGWNHGTLKIKSLKSVSCSGKTMFIDFKKQLDYGNVEFEASIKYNKIMSDCQTWLNFKKNILMSPNHPNNTNCNWLITAEFGSYIILNFKFIEVNSKTRLK